MATTKNGVSLNWGGLDRAMSGAVGRLANRRSLMASIGDALVSGTSKRFEKGEAPDGTAWEPSRRAQEAGGQTLVDTAALMKSIDYAATTDTVMVGTNLPYARIHQEGGTIRPKNKKSLRFKTPGGKVIFAKQVDIPARPYLGVSKADMDEVRATMADFLSGAFRA